MHDVHVIFHVGQNGRFEEETFLLRAFTTQMQLARLIIRMIALAEKNQSAK